MKAFRLVIEDSYIMTTMLAEGVEFGDGAVVARFIRKNAKIEIFKDMTSLLNATPKAKLVYVYTG